MANVPLINLFLVFEGICRVCSHTTVQPCGPKLCEELCLKKGCSAKIFDEIQLSCQLFDSIRTCPITHGRKVENLKKQGPRCSPANVQRFTRACDKNDVPHVKKLFDMRLLDVDCRLKNTITLVMYTAWKNKTDIFDYLVQKKCDLTARNKLKSSVLHIASGYGSLDIVRKLVDNLCSDVNDRDMNGRTPVMKAVQKRYHRIVKFLKERGANMKAADNRGDNILHYACFGGHVDMVKYVLSLNIFDIECRGSDGRSPLMGAVACGKIAAVEFLLQRNASVTALDQTNANVLHIACLFDQVEMLNFLFDMKELNGFLSRKNLFRRTPFQTALQYGRSKVVDYFHYRGVYQ